MGQPPKRNRAVSIKEALAQRDLPRSKRGSVKIQLTLKPEFADRLDELKTRRKASSYSQVIREAIILLEYIQDEIEAGNQIFAREPDRTLIRLKIK